LRIAKWVRECDTGNLVVSPLRSMPIRLIKLKLQVGCHGWHHQQRCTYDAGNVLVEWPRSVTKQFWIRRIKKKIWVRPQSGEQFWIPLVIIVVIHPWLESLCVIRVSKLLSLVLGPRCPCPHALTRTQHWHDGIWYISKSEIFSAFKPQLTTTSADLCMHPLAEAWDPHSSWQFWASNKGQARWIVWMPSRMQEKRSMIIIGGSL